MTIIAATETYHSEPVLEVHMLFKRISAMLEMCDRADLRGEDLTVPQFAMLTHATPDGIPLSEMSTRMLCDNSNLTGIVDRLISKGLVERRPNPQDRRVSLICLTPRGAEKLRKIRPLYHAHLKDRLHGLSLTEIEQLRDLLQVAAQSLEDALEMERSIQVGA